MKYLSLVFFIILSMNSLFALTPEEANACPVPQYVLDNQFKLEEKFDAFTDEQINLILTEKVIPFAIKTKDCEEYTAGAIDFLKKALAAQTFEEIMAIEIVTD